MENAYRFEGNKCFISISAKRYGIIETVIDASDAPRVKMFHWVLEGRKSPYARARIDGNHVIKLHRLITSFSFEIVDHVNGNTLDNRAANLRGVTAGQNRSNSKGKKHPGVKVKASGFEAYINLNRKYKALGTFKTIEEAEAVHRAAHIEAYGEFSKFNRPQGL
jgi:hypothetical protein